jgi:Uncharacterized conserved protein
MFVFLTVGSTRFDSLVQTVLSETVLSSLRLKGYTDLIVQCGKSNFDLENSVRLMDTLRLQKAGVAIEIWQYRPSLQLVYEKVDLVISHAGIMPDPLNAVSKTHGRRIGSGTILDVLRLGIPLIVVPNPTLLDNHQEELASMLAKQGHLEASTIP